MKSRIRVLSRQYCSQHRTSEPSPSIKKNEGTQLDIIRSLAEQLSISKPTDWYTALSRSHVVQLPGGQSMLVAHSDMLSSMLAAAYPDHEFVEWAFQKERVPNYFWSDTTNHKRFFDWVMREANMKDLSGWYILHNRAFHKLGGTQLLHKYYQNKISNFVRAMAPDHEWLDWKFNRFLAADSKQSEFIEWAGIQLGVTKLDDWHNIKGSQLSPLGGDRILVNNNYSLIRILRTVYPAHEWLEWNWKSVPLNFWSSLENRRNYFDWQGRQLDVAELDHWYRVKREQIQRKEALSRGSLVNTLRELYPDHTWLDWKFKSVPLQFWKSVDNQKKFLDWAGKELGVTDLYGWYNVKQTSLDKLGARGLLRHYDSLPKCLAAVYPNHDWDHWKWTPPPE